MRILLTGASGLFGGNFTHHFNGEHTLVGAVNEKGLVNPPYEVVVCDLAVKGAATHLVEQTRPEVIIHAAALANVDACESSPDLARCLNTDLPGEIAAVARRQGIKLVHMSTDCVFDGERGGYAEDDATNPLSIYASTKRDGEIAVAGAFPEAIIARVNFFGFSPSGKRSLGEHFVFNLAVGKPVKGFTDIYFSPLYARHLAETLMESIERDLHGLYHVVGGDALSKYDFGVRIARVFGFDERLIQPISWREGGLTAARSPNLTLRTGKLTTALGHPLPSIDEGIRQFKRDYDAGLHHWLHEMLHP